MQSHLQSHTPSVMATRLQRPTLSRIGVIRCTDLISDAINVVRSVAKALFERLACVWLSAHSSSVGFALIQRAATGRLLQCLTVLITIRQQINQSYSSSSSSAILTRPR